MPTYEAEWNAFVVSLPNADALGLSIKRAVAAVIGGCLLPGGYGPAFGSIIIGMVVIGLTYTGFDQDWFQVLLGGMLLMAVIFNKAIANV